MRENPKYEKKRKKKEEKRRKSLRRERRRGWREKEITEERENGRKREHGLEPTMAEADLAHFNSHTHD